MKLKIAVLFGSRTCEHDVSIISGMQAAGALNPEEYEVERVYLSREGAWYVGEALKDMRFYTHPDFTKVTRVLPAMGDQKLRLLRTETKKKLFGHEDALYGEYDVVMPVMHGMNGEDGSLQGMLELFNVPYTSAGMLGCAVGMDKIAMKQLFRGCGFPVLEGVWFDRARWGNEHDSIMDECEKKLAYPMFVKPANLGSSIGITRATDRDSLEDAIDTACAYDRRILVEQGVENPREVNCSVLGYGDQVRTSALEMPVTDKELLNFSEKYLRGAKGASKGMQSLSRMIPAPIPEEKAAQIRELSEKIFRAMDLKGVTRIDFILDQNDTVFINEANVIPGSLAFYLWEPEGISFSKMLDTMVEAAFRAHADKNGSVYSFDSSILSGLINGSKGKLAR